MTEFTLYARGDSSSAKNASINAEGTSTTPTAELTFSSTSGGDIQLDPNGGLSDPDTLLSVNGGALTTFTVEFSGVLPSTNKLANVNGYDLRGEEVVVITDDTTGQRYFFLTNSELFLTAADWQATMEAFPNGAHNIRNVNSTNTILICFTAGTLIKTTRGSRRVEDLRVGDYVITQDHGPQPIRWIANRTVFAQGNLAPIEFDIGTIGNDTQLRLSPQHRVLVRGFRAQLYFGESEVLVPAKHLVNGRTIRQAHAHTVSYHHFLFDRHEIVTSNGALTESYQPGDTALPGLADRAREELFSVFPSLRADVSALGPAARPSLQNAGQAKLLAA
jgi:hypothetical protein